MKKLNQKGFSLTELLGATIIIGLLIAIITPVISNTLKNNRLSLYERQIEGLIESAKTWGSEHVGSLPADGSQVEVTLEELKKGGYADKNLKNPKNDKPFDDLKTKVIISNDNGILKYQVVIEQE